MLADLEIQAKEQGLQFIEELVFENGAVYRGKFCIRSSSMELSAFLLWLQSSNLRPNFNPTVSNLWMALHFSDA